MSHNSSSKVHSAKNRKIEEYLAYAVRIASNNGRHKCCPYDKIKKDFDWDYLLNQARKNTVSPLLYFSLKEEKKNLPKEFFEEIKKDYYQTLARNILIQEEIKPILQSFEEKKIKVILLKGVALGITAYPSPGLRPMSDVDILVKDNDLLKVNHVLNRAGYFPADINPEDLELPPHPTPSPLRGEEGKERGIGYLTTLDYRNKNLSLHLHRHLVNSTVPNFSYISKIRMVKIFEKAKIVEKDGMKFLTLCPEHLIIYLCEHSLRVPHSLSKLIFLTDISQVIRYYRNEIDWGFLIKESYNFGLEKMVYYGLFAVNKTLGTRIPTEVLPSLKPRRFTLSEKIFLFLLSKNRRAPGYSYLIHLAMNRNLKEKIRFIYRTLFPPKKILAQRNYIPESRVSYLHYLRRGREVLRHLCHSAMNRTATFLL